MRTEAELQTRLKEAVEARRELLQEEIQSEQAQDEATAREVAQDIGYLTAVIQTLEWVLQSGAAIEYEA